MEVKRSTLSSSLATAASEQSTLTPDSSRLGSMSGPLEPAFHQAQVPVARQETRNEKD
jgi:hypothetical protein